jgi:hypothetical protein
MTSHLHTSYERWLFGVGVKREASAKGRHSLEATLTNPIVLRLMQTVSDHISHLFESIYIKAACGERSGP